jgi:predicted site-specific integrase-resolvase
MKNHDRSIRRYGEWLQQIGVSPATGWRFRQRGWIHTTNIGGRLYVSDQQINQFQRRATQGEFALRRTPPLPRQPTKKKA